MSGAGRIRANHILRFYGGAGGRRLTRVAEFNHRWNRRKSTDGKRTLAGLRKVEGKRLTYKFVD
jgi:hypothetical protein